MSDAFPADHPLAPYADRLEDHESHLAVYGEVLADAHPDAVEAAMVILCGADGTDTLPTVAAETEPRWASLWMLGTHIHHVTAAATAASVDEQSMEDIATDAIEMVRTQPAVQEVYDGDA